MTNPFPDARQLLARHGLAAKKSWGQNFLVSERVYRAIVDATVSRDDDWVVEIGAGLGTLTMRLAERVPEGKVYAIERDRDMVAVLRAELGHLEDVEIVEANALTYDLGMVARYRGEPIAVCGNLPYNIASQLLFRIVESRASVARAVVMIQREMADRILAPPGTKAYGALGVMIKTYLDARQVVRAGPGCFVPAPRVESTVLALTPLPEARPRAPIADEAHYSAVVHAAFATRRKTLRNALRARYADAGDAAIDRAGIDGGRRGETLTIDEFAALANAFDPAPAP
jgi:16S rRNA (adenine1518-N6/adenine1519-N6)-dimethyltransferase